MHMARRQLYVLRFCSTGSLSGNIDILIPRHWMIWNPWCAMTFGQLLYLSTYASMHLIISSSRIYMHRWSRCNRWASLVNRKVSVQTNTHPSFWSRIALRCAALHCVACVLHVNMFEVPEASVRLGVETPLTPKAPLRAAKCTTHLHHLFHSRVAFSAWICR